MSCSPFDLRDYYLKELSDPQQRQVESHIHDCPACREELDRLRLTQAALFSLRDEEIPQRIAFVSDPVFEPSRARRWWIGFWGSPARLGFGAAAMLSAALLFSAVMRTGAGMSGAGLSAADVDLRIHQAVADSEARQTKKTTQLVHDLVQKVDTEQGMRLIAEDQVQRLKEVNYQLERATGAYVMVSDARGGLK